MVTDYGSIHRVLKFAKFCQNSVKFLPTLVIFLGTNMA